VRNAAPFENGVMEFWSNGALDFDDDLHLERPPPPTEKGEKSEKMRETARIRAFGDGCWMKARSTAFVRNSAPFDG
jgi:hypothetical protein